MAFKIEGKLISEKEWKKQKKEKEMPKKAEKSNIGKKGWWIDKTTLKLYEGTIKEISPTHFVVCGYSKNKYDDSGNLSDYKIEKNKFNID